MFGEHANFIIPSYAISFISLTLAAAYIIIIYRKRLNELKTLDEAGEKRRSATGKPA